MDNNTMQTEASDIQGHQRGTDKKSIKIKISMKTAVIIAVIVVLGIVAYLGKGLLIAATVDGGPISRLAVIKKLEKASGKGLLDSLITEKLIHNEAGAKKIVVSDDEISAEIKKIEDQVSAQGSTLDAELTSQGLSKEDLKKQIILRKEVEKLIAEKIDVTDAEVAKYIKDNKVPVTKGQEAAMNEQIKNELKGQKFSTEAQALISGLKAKAKIQYFVKGIWEEK